MNFRGRELEHAAFAFLMALSVLLTGCSESASDEAGDDDARGARQKIVDRAKKRAKLQQAGQETRKRVKPQRRKAGAPVSEDDYPELKPADRKTAVALQLALDDDDFAAVKAVSRAALMSVDPEMRKQAVDALAWFGEKALPELTSMLADPDEDVASSALDASSQALSDMNDPEVQFDTAASYMTILSSNSDAVDAFSTSLSASADSICVPDDIDDPKAVAKAAGNRKFVVETLGKMIMSGGKLAEAAKEAYSYVSGNDWCGLAEANLWARDPDGYEPPETQEE